MTGVEYPTLDDAVYVCERLGLYVRDGGALESALARPASIVWGTEAYVGIHLKGAALLDALNRSDPLVDGNRRLSWTMVDLLYTLNGLRLTVEPGEGDAFIRAVGGDEHLGLDEIAVWLERRSAAIDE